jgi:hypothetical protein
MVTKLLPWTFVLSEYLDLSYLLRHAGEQVVAARSAKEALEWLGRCSPRRIVVDSDCKGAEQVMAFARRHCPGSRIEAHEAVVNQLLAC